MVFSSAYKRIELDHVIREKCEDAVRKVFYSLSESFDELLEFAGTVIQK
jgi:hypothetical protein